MTPNIAFIGLGTMAHRMLTNMTAHGGFRFVGGWDPSTEACARTKTAFPQLDIAKSASAIIEDPRTDAVYIASPPAVHDVHAKAAIAAGKALFCEKPLGVDVATSQALVDAVEKSGLPNAVNYPFADALAANTILDAIKSGALGDVTGVDIRLHFSLWPRDWQANATWLAERAEGGFVREVFSHFVYLTERLFGPATLEHASVLYPDNADLCETQFLARLACKGIRISAAGGSGGRGPDQVEFTVWGSSRSYRLWDWNRLQSSTGGPWQDELTDLKDLRAHGYNRMLDNTRAWLAGESHTMASFRDALSVQIIVEKILRAG